ncbi:Glutamate racemase [uncultured archaeon]|nr:Glutamate racemase [uncultured archaeon]
MSDNRPIGIFDSGVGGITVLRALKQILPKENFIYFGDTGRVPYGSKSPEVVVDYSVQIAEFLKEKDVKAIVIACNTATARAGKVLEDLLDIPVIGVIKPSSKEAVVTSKSGLIGVIGTKNTIDSQMYVNEIAELNPEIKVYGKPAPMIASYIEENEAHSPGLITELERYLNPLKEKGIDTLILGCTHYSLIKNQIQKVVGEEIKLIDSGISTAQEVHHLLTHTDKMFGGMNNGRSIFYVTGGVQEFQDKLMVFESPTIHVHQIEIVHLTRPIQVNKVVPYEIPKEQPNIA